MARPVCGNSARLVLDFFKGVLSTNVRYSREYLQDAEPLDCSARPLDSKVEPTRSVEKIQTDMNATTD
jgi:hypothetical protein